MAKCTCGHLDFVHRGHTGACDGLPSGGCPCASFYPAREAGPPDEPDPVNHPAHYTKHPSGVECIQITEHMNFNLGNAIKYLWRAGEKGAAIEDLRKARWYVEREIDRITRMAKKDGVK